MYKIKAKQGYNVIIEDLNITLRSHGSSIDVDKKIFDESADAKKVLNFIEIVDLGDIESITDEKINEINNEILQVGDNSFVARSAFEKNPEDVFIAKPAYIDQVVEQTNEIKNDEILNQEIEVIPETEEMQEVKKVKEVKEVAKIKEIKKVVNKTVKDKKPSAKKNAKK